jgi:hypothetical protein
MESQCLIITKIFIKTENHLNPFLNLFSFCSKIWHIYFWHKYKLTSYHMKFKKCIFLAFDFFGFWLTIIWKTIVKILHNNDMVEVQTWNPWKKYNVTTIPPPSVLKPYASPCAHVKSISSNIHPNISCTQTMFCQYFEMLEDPCVHGHQATKWSNKRS